MLWNWNQGPIQETLGWCDHRTVQVHLKLKKNQQTNKKKKNCIFIKNYKTFHNQYCVYNTSVMCISRNWISYLTVIKLKCISGPPSRFKGKTSVVLNPSLCKSILTSKKSSTNKQGPLERGESGTERLVCFQGVLEVTLAVKKVFSVEKVNKKKMG